MNSECTSKHMEENAKETIYFWTAKQFGMSIHTNVCKKVFILVDIEPCFFILEFPKNETYEKR